MPYPIYATKEDVINYLALQDESTLPSDIEKLLKRASELIYYVTFGNVIIEKQSHKDATKLATCAQVEYWMQVSEQVAISGQIANSFSIGDLSMNFGDSSGSNKSQLAQRAKQFLNAEGLMYRGVDW